MVTKYFVSPLAFKYTARVLFSVAWLTVIHITLELSNETTSFSLQNDGKEDLNSERNLEVNFHGIEQPDRV